MKVYTARVLTESSDHYVWVYNYKPTEKEVIKQVWETEGSPINCDWDFQYYLDTTSVFIEKTTIIEKG